MARKSRKSSQSTQDQPRSTGGAPSSQDADGPEEESPAVEKTAPPGNAGFPVVAIGASAGGLETFQQFFKAMPEDSNLAFVLIQHLDPHHSSMTAEVLGKRSPIPFVEVKDEMQMEANRAYVIPPNRYLTISGRTLHLTEPIERRGIRVPIDFFFRSLADDQQECAIGIILTGSGSDGALG